MAIGGVKSLVFWMVEIIHMRGVKISPKIFPKTSHKSKNRTINTVVFQSVNQAMAGILTIVATIPWSNQLKLVAD